MSLKFIYGRSGSGKSSFCIDDMKSKLIENSESQLFYIVPEQFSFQAEKNILNSIGEESNLNVHVLSFKRMAYRVMGEVGGITRKHMDSAGKCMLISHVLESVFDDLTVFKRASLKEGFINTVSDLISEFKRYALTPEVLTKTAEDMTEDTNLKDKLKDLSIIYGKFEDELHKNYIDSDDDLTVLSEKLEKSKMFDNAYVWIDEFTSFTPQQYKIIEKLLNKAKRVSITLTSDYGSDMDASDIFQFTKSTEDRIVKITGDNNISIDKPSVLYKRPFGRFKDSSELSFLEKNLFSYHYEKYKDIPKDIELFRAQNTYSEIESTARDIVRMCRDNGFRYKDIAVVTRNLDNYESIISAIFKEHDIPFFIDKKRDIDGNLIVVLITSAIEIINSNWSYEAVFKYLKTGLTNVSKEDVDVFENYVLAAGIKGIRKWIYEEQWTYMPDSFLKNNDMSKDESEFLNRINKIREIVVTHLKKLYLTTRGKKNAKEICTAIYEFLTEIGADKKVQDLIDEFRNSERQLLSSEYSQIWNTIMDLLDQTVEVMKDSVFTLSEFQKILSIGLRQHKMGLIPPSVDEVLVGSVERLKSHDICVLYIVGVNDGVFPLINNEEGILSDAERINLKNKGVELAKDTRTAAFEEQFLVYTTLTIPGKFLRLSYPMADYEGKTLRTSIIVSKIKSIFPKIKEQNDLFYNGADEEIKLIDSKVPAFNLLVNVLRKRIDGEENLPLWKDVYKWFSNSEYWRRRCKIAFDGASYSNQAKSISREKAQSLYGKDMTINVSRLEKYAQCPFAYYVQYGLKAKERKVFNLSYPDMGTFMHEVLDEFSEKLKDNKFEDDKLSDEFCVESIDEIADKKINEKNSYIFNSSPKYKYMTERLKRVLRRTSIIIADHIKRSAFKPVGFEMDFSKYGKYPPIVVELSSGEKVNLIGRIDRIDMLIKDDETYIRIIDYKSGNKIFKLSDVYYGLQVQLILYLDAILQNESKDMDKNVLPGAILYFKIDDPIIRSNENLDEDQLKLEIMKNFKMKGLLLDDPHVIKEMDKQMNGASYIIPASLKKDGNLGANSSTATKHQFELLREHVKNIVTRDCEKMLMGDISISPCKNKDLVPCEYCLFSSICSFDSSFDDNNYRMIFDRSDKEVFNMLSDKYDKEEGENHEDDMDQ
ncbi:MAG: helicase-exonuclease AddAB subunit AddB [Clostridium sp.]|nr:helicase-exonuclease AddAB subunit AddB [Clostridium sp.]